MNARRVVAALAIFVMVAGGLIGTFALLSELRHSPPAAAPQTSQARATPTPQVPTPAEFQLGVIVTDQDCSVPNGCVYKYRVEPKYVGFHPLPDKPFTVAYQVTGGHQPQTGEFTVQAGQARISEALVDGPPGARLQAAVTRITG